MGALLEGRLEPDRSVMFRQKVRERLIGEFLELHHAVARQQIEGRPGLFVELYALARHVFRTYRSD
jgi:hypothetical protein